MKKLLFLGVVTVSVVLAACQVNNVRDTGGGAVSPSSTVTGVTLDGVSLDIENYCTVSLFFEQAYL